MMNFSSIAMVVMIEFTVASSMSVPKAKTEISRNINQPVNQQASFALSRVLANTKYGSTAGHFPVSGIEGTESYGCNAGM